MNLVAMYRAIHKNRDRNLNSLQLENVREIDQLKLLSRHRLAVHSPPACTEAIKAEAALCNINARAACDMPVYDYLYLQSIERIAP